MSNLSEAIHLQAYCPTGLPLNNTALVAEGGGQRGIYTAGVLDAWLHRDFNPFSILIGTSAGAQNISSFITGQKGYARRSIFGLTQKSKFFKFKRSLVGRNIVDLDWYFEEVEKAPIALNTDCGLKRMEGRAVLFSATATSDRRAYFFSPNQENWLALLKASSALPILYKNGVKLGDDRYVDGGLSAPIPVREAYERGAKRIVVIRTMPKDAEIESPWAHKLKTWLCSSQRCPAVIDLITHHELAYRRALEFIENPPKDVEIIQIHPEQALASKLVNSRFEDLDKDYNMGVADGLAFLNQFESRFAA